jgi:hypothetical protein
MQIYLGSRIVHASERTLLERINCIAAALDEDVVVLVNVNFSGRQIDLILCLEGQAIVFEAKGYTRPVRGRRNGAWQVQLSNGTWKETDNAYIQALNAKNALRDAMRAFEPFTQPPYPSAAVVFTPELPAQSAVESGDFKVAIIGLTALEDVLRVVARDSWSLDRWRAFARHHRLTPVATVEGSYDERVWDDERLIASYSEEFSRTYGPSAENLVPFACAIHGETTVISHDVAKDISAGNADVLLRGPSGCGKSLLAQSAATAALGTRVVPIFIAAKDFETSIKTVLDREVGLLAACSTVELLAASRRQQRKLLLIVDGYNECMVDRRERLTRCVAALRRRIECSLLITSRIDLARAELLSLRQVDVLPPSTAVKRAIALQDFRTQPLSAHLEPLIEAVTSGLEARLVGEVGQALGSQPSRHELFDAYVRNRLGDGASTGIRALTEIADWLNEHLTFSVARRDLDRLVPPQHVDTEVLSELIEKGLITLRAGRLSFSHEMFFHAFAAEAVLRSSEGDAEAISRALKDPRHADRRDLIVGAIEDLEALARILEHVSDASLVASCLAGACGRFPREWIAARYPQVLSTMHEEVNGVHCESNPASSWGVSITTNNPLNRENSDRALVVCLSELVSQGVYFDEIWELVATLDQRLAHEYERLRTEPHRGINLKSSIFAQAYVVDSLNSLALTRVCMRLHNDSRVKSSLVPEIARRAARDNLTPGQLYVLASLCRNVRDGLEAPALVSIVAELIEKYGKDAPYHVQLALVEAAQHCSFLVPERDERLIEALKSLPNDRNIGLNSMVFDALQVLGAFEIQSCNLEPEIRETIARLVSDADNTEGWAEADTLYNSQFDGPYSDAYSNAVNETPEKQRKVFLEMAAKGAEYASHFLPILLIDLAALNDPTTEAAFHQWTAAPPHSCFMPQEAIEAFALAHVALARLQVDLPPRVGNNSAERALLACGRLLYWGNRIDGARQAKEEAVREAWLTLSSVGAQEHALNVLSACSQLMIETTDKFPGGAKAQMSIVKLYPQESTRVCRRALEQPESLAGYFQFYDADNRLRDQTFALGVLGQHGQSTDLPLLRKLAQSPELGRAALIEIRRLEERLNEYGSAVLKR